MLAHRTPLKVLGQTLDFSLTIAILPVDLCFFIIAIIPQKVFLQRTGFTSLKCPEDNVMLSLYAVSSQIFATTTQLIWVSFRYLNILYYSYYS